MTEPLEMKASKNVEITEIVYEGLKREWRLTLDADAIDAEVDSRLAQLQSSANLPGFRKGRAPIHILRQREGGRIRDETKARTIMDAARAQVRQEGPPVRNPQLKPVDDEDSLAYTLSFEKMPEIPDLDFNSATLIRYKVDPEKNYEAMVKFILEKLFGADARHEHLPVGDKASQDRITAKGDWLALTGTRKSKSHHQVLSHPIEIIAGQDLDSLPSDRTIGLKQGDAITFEAESTVTGMSGGETTAEHFTYDLEVLRVMPPLGLSGENSMFADMEEAERRTTYDHFLKMAIKSTDQFCKQLLEDQIAKFITKNCTFALPPEYRRDLLTDVHSAKVQEMDATDEDIDGDDGNSADGSEGHAPDPEKALSESEVSAIDDHLRYELYRKNYLEQYNLYPAQSEVDAITKDVDGDDRESEEKMTEAYYQLCWDHFFEHLQRRCLIQDKFVTFDELRGLAQGHDGGSGIDSWAWSPIERNGEMNEHPDTNS